MSDTAEGTSSPAPSTPGVPAGSSTAGPSQSLRLGVVLKTIVPLIALGAVALVVFGVLDGAAWIRGLTIPPLVPVTGLVTYQGKPLAGAQISTQFAGRKVRGAIGWTDDAGRFTLQTDLNGYVPGAYVGEHQVIVTQFQTTNAPMQPPLLTPELYSTFATTPLRIRVSRSADANTFTFTLEGEPPASRVPAAGDRPPLAPPPIGQQPEKAGG